MFTNTSVSDILVSEILLSKINTENLVYLDRMFHRGCDTISSSTRYIVIVTDPWSSSQKKQQQQIQGVLKVTVHTLKITDKIKGENYIQSRVRLIEHSYISTIPRKVYPKNSENFCTTLTYPLFL